MHDLKGITGLGLWAFKMQGWLGHNGFKRGDVNEETLESHIGNRIRVNAYLSISNFEQHQVKCTSYLRDGWVPNQGDISITVTEDAWGALKR